MSETEMIREAVKGFLKPIIAEAMAEVAAQPTTVEGKRYYTREEAQEHLKIGTTTFYRMAKKGKIEILKIGGKTLVDADALDDAIERQEVVRYGR